MLQPNETSEQIKPQVKTALDRNVDEMYKVLVTDAKANVAVLPEAHFRDWFLPQFACRVPMAADAIPKWISVAGWPGAEVAIIDEAGQELFRVPPLFPTDHIKRIRPDGVLDFSSIGKLMELQARKSPAQAAENMKRSMLARYKASHEPGKELTENEKKWLHIFERYGYLTAAELAAQKTAPENKAADTGELDDDDFVAR